MKDFITGTLICCLIVIVGALVTAVWPEYRGAFVGLMVSTAFFCGERRGESK